MAKARLRSLFQDLPLRLPAHSPHALAPLARNYCISRGQALNASQPSQMTHQKPVIAVLYQALAPPMYDGVSKPPKPGGSYRYMERKATIGLVINNQQVIEILVQILHMHFPGEASKSLHQ